MGIRERFRKLLYLLEKNNKYQTILVEYVSIFVFVLMVIWGFLEMLDVPVQVKIGDVAYDRRILHIILALVLTPNILLLSIWLLRGQNYSKNDSFEKLLTKLLLDICVSAEQGNVVDGRITIRTIKKFFDYGFVVKIDAISTAEILAIEISKWLGKIKDTVPGEMHELTEEAIIAYAEISKNLTTVESAKKMVDNWRVIASSDPKMKLNVSRTLDKAVLILTSK